MDIIARDGGVLVFVEVKTRAGRFFGDAAEAVTPLKQRRMTRLASEYLLRHPAPRCPCRFDVVSIHFDGERPTVDVFRAAFDAAADC